MIFLLNTELPMRTNCTDSGSTSGNFAKISFPSDYHIRHKHYISGKRENIKISRSPQINLSKIWQNLHRVIIVFLVLAQFCVSFYLSVSVFSLFPLMGSVILFFVSLLLLFFMVSYFFRPAELQRRVA